MFLNKLYLEKRQKRRLPDAAWEADARLVGLYWNDICSREWHERIKIRLKYMLENNLDVFKSIAAEALKRFLPQYIKQIGQDEKIMEIIIFNYILFSKFRPVILSISEINWAIVVNISITELSAQEFLQRFNRELEHHEDSAPFDDDVFYCYDIGCRLNFNGENRKVFSELTQKLDKLFPGFSAYVFGENGSPNQEFIEKFIDSHHLNSNEPPF